MIIYDCEIIKAIPPKNPDEERLEGIEYCDGWHDHAGMGISVIGSYDYMEDRYRVFCQDNFSEFQELIDGRSVVVGFNSLAFDNNLVAAHGITIPEEASYDVLVEIWRAMGLGPHFKYPSHAGYGLDAVCEANFGVKKTGNGALAPVDWQRGEIGKVIDYCINDVMMTKLALDEILHVGALVSPVNDDVLSIRRPN